jgi:hypothetical protein
MSRLRRLRPNRLAEDGVQLWLKGEERSGGGTANFFANSSCVVNINEMQNQMWKALYRCWQRIPDVIRFTDEIIVHP